MINIEELKKLAHLSRIRFPENEIGHMQNDIERILKMLADLQKVNTDNIDPIINIMEDYPLPFREDKVVDGGDAKAVLANAPARDNYENIDYFIVPKVVE